MTSHTPGPWMIEDRLVYVLDSGINRFSAHIQNDNGLASNEELLANVRLIADAPAMLDLLEDIKEEFDGRYDGAPDARMQWMGHLLDRINRLIDAGKAGVA